MDINNLMKQAQQMQEKMSAMQEQAAKAEVTGESGAGMGTGGDDRPSRCAQSHLGPLSDD